MSNYKYRANDKYDAFMPNKAHWVHDHYAVSSHSDNFHADVTYTYPVGNRRSGLVFGVNKRMWRTSGGGVSVDCYSVGKSDHS